MHLQELNVRFNNIIRIITYSNKYSLMTNLYNSHYLGLLKLAIVKMLKVAKYMYQLHNNKLSKSLYDDYAKINETHNYDTEQIRNKVYFKPRINKSVRKNRLVYRD